MDFLLGVIPAVVFRCLDAVHGRDYTGFLTGIVHELGSGRVIMWWLGLLADRFSEPVYRPRIFCRCTLQE